MRLRLQPQPQYWMTMLHLLLPLMLQKRRL
jgi:hypothetical protein